VSDRDHDIRVLEADLTRALGLNVDIEDRGERVRVCIDAHRLEQLDALCQRLMSGEPLTPPPIPFPAREPKP